ncbi:zinc finger BED domain-containing protein 1-like [Octopus sinensis]|uniref:Zinc finger BED domain-containing protein 1-like n=1 Tax=Octopus sinensis TaxID=2607531 RepID=A0A6P7TRG2_9MOLL|nr:zinc finger BED domain-containing protein 1-like [Octopus sinensis]
MYRKSGSNSNNSKMAAEKNRVMKYKSISARLHEHFGFKLLADGNIKILITFIASIATNRSHTLDLTDRLLTTLKTNTRYSKPHLAKSASFSQSTAALSFTSKQITLNQFYRRFDHLVSATVQRDIKTSLAHWKANSGRPISTVNDGLHQVLRTALQNTEYKLPCRQTIDKMLADIYNSKRESVKKAVKNSKAIALKSDFLTSLGNESYCRITGHWIADDWKLISVIPECVHVVERHYSNNVAVLYKQFVKDWDITKKIQVLVTDNVRNLVSAVNQIDFTHIPCLAHSFS